MGGYWHIFRLGPEHCLVTGENTLEAILLERDPDVVEGFCTLGDVDPDLGPHD
jgi:hypothetical protein